jgi:hypothetical protein
VVLAPVPSHRAGLAGASTVGGHVRVSPVAALAMACGGGGVCPCALRILATVGARHSFYSLQIESP